MRDSHNSGASSRKPSWCAASWKLRAQGGAALRADPNVLILTGGRRPSEYLFDAASAKGIPVLLSRTDTENTVIALEGVFDHTRFQGDRKLDRMAELLEGSGLFEALA